MAPGARSGRSHHPPWLPHFPGEALPGSGVSGPRKCRISDLRNIIYLPRRSTCGYISTISTEAANLLWLAIEGAVLDGMQEGGPLMLGFSDLKICFGVSGEPLDIQKGGGSQTFWMMLELRGCLNTQITDFQPPSVNPQSVSRRKVAV